MQQPDRLSYRLDGTNGKGVMLIHGLTGIPAEMKLIARDLNRAGYTVFAPLLTGHGIDRATLVKSSWQDWLQGITTHARSYAREVDSLYTAGICVGGKLGMMAAHHLPGTIKATAIYSPCFRFDGWNVPWYYKLAPLGLPVMMRCPWWRERTYSETESLGIKDERLRAFMQSAEAEGVIDEFPAISLMEMYQLGKAMKRILPAMRTPSLIMHANEDDLSNPRHARYISQHIGAHHELHWVDDSYHMIHVDRQHHHVAEITAQFFGGGYASNAA